MTADCDRARFDHFVVASAQNLAQYPAGHIRSREGDDIQGRKRPSPHREDIGEGIGCGNLTETVRVIDDRRKKIHGLNQRLVFTDTKHPGVVSFVEPDQKIRVRRLRQVFQRVSQEPWPQFGSSTGAAYLGGQFDGHFFATIIHAHMIPGGRVRRKKTEIDLGRGMIFFCAKIEQRMAGQPV